MFPALAGVVGLTELLFVAHVVAATVAAADALLRDDLATRRKALLFALVVLIPLAWLPYFLLGRERTRRLVGG